jgi:hypothetical protein
MNAKRYLIVNANDFGLSANVNQGIIEADPKAGTCDASRPKGRWPAAGD